MLKITMKFAGRFTTKTGKGVVHAANQVVTVESKEDIAHLDPADYSVGVVEPVKVSGKKKIVWQMPVPLNRG